MEAGFWHRKWEENDIAFHNREANPLLVRHFQDLNVAGGGRVFVPLCGKTLDIGWLLSQGYRVVGAELSTLAIEQLFDELGIEPKVSTHDDLTHFSAGEIDIFVGDIFDLTAERLGPVDAVYDRAALVALPEDVRKRYTEHLEKITGCAPQLLITFEYDQSLMAGPPFSISAAEVSEHYANNHVVKLVESQEVAGGLKGQCPAQENVWLLSNA